MGREARTPLPRERDWWDHGRILVLTVGCKGRELNIINRPCWKIDKPTLKQREGCDTVKHKVINTGLETSYKKSRSPDFREN